MTGRKFNKLTVISFYKTVVPRKGYKKYLWLCQCDCGKQTIVKDRNLRSGDTKSCGCLRYGKHDIGNDNHKKKRNYNNDYEIKGEYTIGYTIDGDTFLIDTEDLKRIKEHNWHKQIAGNRQGYIIGHGTSLHRFIMNCPKGYMVDHINHDKTDNRKSNLRIVTPAQNNYNHSLQRNNTTGVTGVYQINGKWTAKIQVNYKQINIGTFLTKEEAVEARKAAEEKYFGVYAHKENDMDNIKSEIIYGQKPLFPDRSYVELVRKDNNKLDLIHSIKGNVYTHHYVLKDASYYEPFKAFILQMVDPNESDEENVIGIAEGGTVEDAFEWVDYDNPAWDTTLAVEINELDRYLFEAETRLEIHYYKEGYYFQDLDDKSEGEIINLCNFSGINYNKPLDGYSTDYWEGVVSTLRYLTLADEGKHSCDVFG